MAAESAAHFGSDSILIGRGGGAVPSNVTVPVITPGPFAVSVGAAALDGGVPVLDGSEPHALTAMKTTVAQSIWRIRAGMKELYPQNTWFNRVLCDAPLSLSLQFS